MKKLLNILALPLNVAVAMLGYNVNVAADSYTPLFWSVVDFFFGPLALAKWLVCHQLTHSLLVQTFGFLST